MWKPRPHRILFAMMKTLKRRPARLLVLCAILLAVATAAAARRVPYALIFRNGYHHVIDTGGRIVADSLRYTNGPQLDALDEGMFAYVRADRLGFKNHRNEIAVPPVYRMPPGSVTGHVFAPATVFEARFRQGLAVVASAGGRFGIVNTTGQLVVDTVYDYIAPPDSGVYAARRGDTLQLFDRSGRNLLTHPYVTDPKLYPYPRMREGRLCVLVRAGGIPYKDLPGFAGPHEIQFGGSSAREMHTYKAGFVDRRGRLVIDTVFRLDPMILGNSEIDIQAAKLSGGICGSGMQRIARRGHARDPFYLSSDYYEFSGGRCLAWNGGMHQVVIDVAGDSLFTIPGGTVIRNLRGCFSVDAGNRWSLPMPGERREYHCGLYDPRGRLIVPMRHAGITDAGKGLFLVAERPYGSDGSYFYVNGAGVPLSDHRYVLGGPFVDGYASVLQGDGKSESRTAGRIDTRGRFLPSGEQEFYGTDGTYVLVSRKSGDKSRRIGLMDRKGRWIIPPVHSSIKLPSCGRIAFASREPGTTMDRWGYMDMTGRVLIEPQFEGAGAFELVEIEESQDFQD